MPYRAFYLFFLLVFLTEILFAQHIENKTLNSIHEIRGLNYYPQKNPWDTFGDSFDKKILQKDFSLIRNMGLNTIRIFVQYNDFGGGNPSTEKINRLHDLMQLASKEGLGVMVTLFDFYGNYDLKNWKENQAHLRIVVDKLKDHSNLIAWDVKNEPDLDFESRGKEKVVNWLVTVIDAVKSRDKSHPVTIGWSKPEDALNLKDKVDFVSFHYYRDISNLKRDFHIISSKTSKPVVLQEYGLSSYSGFSNFFASSEKKQAVYYEEVTAVIEENSIPYLFWTLYDFKKIPEQVVGKKVKYQRQQQHFGIIGVNQKKKQAYLFVNQNDGLLNVSLKVDY